MVIKPRLIDQVMNIIGIFPLLILILIQVMSVVQKTAEFMPLTHKIKKLMNGTKVVVKKNNKEFAKPCKTF